MVYIFVLSACIVLVLLIALWVKKTTNKFRRIKDKAKFNVMPSAGLINSTLDLIFQQKGLISERIMKQAKKYSKGEGIYHTFLGPFSLLFVLNPEDTHKVLYQLKLFVKAKPPKESTFHRMLADAVGQQEGDEWRRQRGILNPSFANLDQYLPSFDATIKHSLNTWDSMIDEKTEQGYIPVGDMFQRMTLDVLAKTIFGFDLGAIDGRIDDLRSNYNVMFQLVFSLKEFIVPFMKTKEQKIHLQNFEKGMKKIIDKAYARKENGDLNRNSMLDIMIDSIDEATGSGFTYNQVFQNVTGFFLAGHETTSTILTFTCYELAKNSELQRKCIQEVDRVLGKQEEITPDHINALEYIPLVIKEMQRMYQPTGVVPRITTSDTELCGYHVPKGTMIITQFTYLHHDKKIWGDPEVFRPERFSPQESIGRHPTSFVPFSTGPHTCIGNTFSLLEQKVFYLKLLQRYSLELEPGYRLESNKITSTGLLDENFRIIIKRRK
jgi:cytochrome P450